MTNHREATETAQDNFLDAIAKNTKAGVGQPTQIAALLRCAAFLSVAVEVTEEQWLCFARKSYEQAQAGFKACEAEAPCSQTGHPTPEVK